MSRCRARADAVRIAGTTLVALCSCMPRARGIKRATEGRLGHRARCAVAVGWDFARASGHHASLTARCSSAPRALADHRLSRILLLASRGVSKSCAVQCACTRWRASPRVARSSTRGLILYTNARAQVVLRTLVLMQVCECRGAQVVVHVRSLMRSCARNVHALVRVQVREWRGAQLGDLFRTLTRARTPCYVRSCSCKCASGEVLNWRCMCIRCCALARAMYMCSFACTSASGEELNSGTYFVH